MFALKTKRYKSLLKRFYSKEVDLVIVGDDAPGLAIAWALKESYLTACPEGHDKKMVLLKQSKIPKLDDYINSDQKRKPDPKIITITFSTLKMLHSLGVLDRMNHLLISPYRKMFVNESFGKSCLSFEDDIIDNNLLAQVQQSFYDSFISDSDYYFYGK